jgi:alkyl sulfatase BDS1-like metallo-beta-lactamase superfamily hydrolase
LKERRLRYVEMMGGPDDAVAKARTAFDAGDYRWVAEVVQHVVFADSSATRPKPAPGETST